MTKIIIFGTLWDALPNVRSHSYQQTAVKITQTAITEDVQWIITVHGTRILWYRAVHSNLAQGTAVCMFSYCPQVSTFNYL